MMNFNYTNGIIKSINSQKTAFKMNYTQCDNDATSKIKLAIKFIVENPEINLNLGTLSKISGLSTQELYDYIFNSSNYELFEIWHNAQQEKLNASDINAIASLEQKSDCISTPCTPPRRLDTIWSKNESSSNVGREKPSLELTKKEVSNAEYDKIESAIWQILNDPALEATTANIAKLTGLSINNVLYRLHSTRSDKIYNLWQYVQDVKEEDTIQRRQRLAKFYNIDDRSVVDVKIKNSAAALKMIKHAVSTRSKVRYSEIEKCSGLTRDEIDKLIIDYANTIQQRTLIARRNKELQAKWYEENASVS